MRDGLETIEILAKRILARAVLPQMQLVFQERYEQSAPAGTKAPLRLYIVNRGATESEAPNTNFGSPVNRVELFKLLPVAEPQGGIESAQKPLVYLRFRLVLIVEFEDGGFEILHLPEGLSTPEKYEPAAAKAFVDATVIGADGIPAQQRQSAGPPLDSLVIRSGGTDAYTEFCYAAAVPLSQFSPEIQREGLLNPALRAYVLLQNPAYAADVLGQQQVFTRADRAKSVWTTIVDFSLYEDVIGRLGVEQSIQLLATPEYEYTDEE